MVGDAAMTEVATETEQAEDREPDLHALCPHCGTYRWGRRSRLRWFDLPLLLLYVRPVRCTDCYGRYYRFIRSRSIHPQSLHS